MSQDSFQKISDLDKSKIFEQLLSQSIELSAKGSHSEAHRLALLSKDNQGRLELSLIVSNSIWPVNEKVLVNFVYQGRRYFFQGNIEIQDQKIFIETKEPLYGLQSRQHPRLNIPHDIKALFTISTLGGMPVFLQSKVLDFGLGGLRVRVSGLEPQIKMMDLMTGFLEIDKNVKVKLLAQVRHVTNTKQGDAKAQMFGVQFASPSEADKAKLENIFVNLQTTHIKKSES